MEGDKPTIDYTRKRFFHHYSSRQRLEIYRKSGAIHKDYTSEDEGIITHTIESILIQNLILAGKIDSEGRFVENIFDLLDQLEQKLNHEL